MDFNSITGLATGTINATNLLDVNPELLATGGFVALLGFIWIILAAILLPVYIYGSLTMMLIAKKLNHPYPWLAWIPVANTWMMAELGKMPGWVGLIVALSGTLASLPVIGLFIGAASAVLAFVWMWRICEARHKPGWWPLLVLIPIIGWIWYPIMLGILAWGKE